MIKNRQRWQLVGRGLAQLGAFGLIACTLLAYVFPVGWLTGLLQHFPAYYAAAWLAVAVCAFLGAASRRMVLGSLLGSVIYLAFWASPRIPAEVITVSEGEALRVVWANLWHKHEVVEEFVDWIDQMDPAPDVIGVAEVHERRSLELLRERFPYGLSDAGPGVALFSRRKPKEQSSILVSGARPILRMALPVGENQLEVVAAHALVPVGVGHQLTFDRLEAHLGQQSEAVLIGDLNTTPWSREYRGLVEHAGLRDARRGKWPWATWHAAGWIPAHLPIDHAMSRGRVEVLRFELGPDLGSDHLPLVLDVRVHSEAGTVGDAKSPSY